MTTKLKWKLLKNKKPKMKSKVLLRSGYVARLFPTFSDVEWSIECPTHEEAISAQDSDKWVSFSELVKFLDKQ